MRHQWPEATVCGRASVMCCSGSHPIFMNRVHFGVCVPCTNHSLTTLTKRHTQFNSDIHSRCNLCRNRNSICQSLYGMDRNNFGPFIDNLYPHLMIELAKITGESPQIFSNNHHQVKEYGMLLSSLRSVWVARNRVRFCLSSCVERAEEYHSHQSISWRE